MIITSVSTAAVRVILRIYFIVVLALTGWLAKKTVHLGAQIQVVRSNSVPAVRVLGSLDGLSLLFAPFKLRRFPSGF